MVASSEDRHAAIRFPCSGYRTPLPGNWCLCCREGPDSRVQNAPAHKEPVGSPRSIQPRCVEGRCQALRAEIDNDVDNRAPRAAHQFVSAAGGN